MKHNPGPWPAERAELLEVMREYVAAYDLSRETMDPSHEWRAVEKARALLKRIEGE